jgi:hypothetical protein
MVSAEDLELGRIIEKCKTEKGSAVKVDIDRL